MRSPRSPPRSRAGCSASWSTANSSRSGSGQAIQVDVRFILATRENLPALVEQRKFRRDLFERINDICLKLPPLRQRGNDAVILAEHSSATDSPATTASPSSASPPTPTTSCSGTTGRATSASSRASSSGGWR